MSIRTLEHLSDALARDLAWRKKELAALRFACKATKQKDTLNGLYRSSVAMLYAHWEGFIKNASAAYLEYVHFQRLRLAELAPNFAAVAARSMLRAGGGL